ncbi:MAG: mannose-1-phosphate guanylyltransferase [Saprospiraceae bacterium]|nr:mannose-1-phosphate guanylyltransferase [Saprospiraceae bacterium]
MTTHQYILIMAGGVGSRFWPASREQRPKQFLDIMGTGRSLLQTTFDRCAQIVSPSQIYIITNEVYAAQVAHHLPELQSEQIFTEPSRNNTAPCIAYASLKLAKRDPEGVCLVAPSDHLIADEQEYIHTVQRAMRYAARHQVLMTLGMTPTRPDTGYGYIQYDHHPLADGIYPVKRFTEKPVRAMAEQFVASGDYLWNSGMFVWSLDAVLAAFAEHAIETYEILRAGIPHYFTAGESAFLAEHYPQTEKTSVDYAIMERAQNVCVVPAEFGWSDLGTWNSLYEQMAKDDHGNVQIHQPVVVSECSNTLVHTLDGKLVVVAGLTDVVVVSEKDVVLVFPRDREQEIKQLRARLESNGLDEYL